MSPLALIEASIVYVPFALAAVSAANSSRRSAAVRIAGGCYRAPVATLETLMHTIDALVGGSEMVEGAPLISHLVVTLEGRG